MAKICEQLKTNLGELDYLLEELGQFIGSNDNKKAVAIKRKMEAIMQEMAEPLGWALYAKAIIDKFAIEYTQAMIDIEVKNSFGNTFNWIEIRKYCSIDIENRKIHIKPKGKSLDLSGMNVVLSKNTVIDGDLVLDRYEFGFPDDLIVNGNVRISMFSEKLKKQLTNMHANGQIKGKIIQTV